MNTSLVFIDSIYIIDKVIIWCSQSVKVRKTGVSLWGIVCKCSWIYNTHLNNKLIRFWNRYNSVLLIISRVSNTSWICRTSYLINFYLRTKCQTMRKFTSKIIKCSISNSILDKSIVPHLRLITHRLRRGTELQCYFCICWSNNSVWLFNDIRCKWLSSRRNASTSR